VFEAPDATPEMRGWLELATAFLRRLAPRDVQTRRIFGEETRAVQFRSGNSAGGGTGVDPGRVGARPQQTGGTGPILGQGPGISSTGVGPPSPRAAPAPIGGRTRTGPIIGGGPIRGGTSSGPIIGGDPIGGGTASGAGITPGHVGGSAGAGTGGTGGGPGPGQGPITGGAAGTVIVIGQDVSAALALAAGLPGTMGGQQPAVSMQSVPSTTFVDEFNNNILDRYWKPITGTWSEGVGELDAAAAATIWFNADLMTDGWASVAMVNPTMAMGHEVFFRMDAALQNGYSVKINNKAGSPALALFLYIAGTGVQLAQVSHAIADGDVLKIQCLGTAITGWLNGVQIVATADATYASGYAGLGCAALAAFKSFTRSTVAP